MGEGRISVGVMSQNLRLVNYFISEFYSNNTFDLSHIVSPEFEFFLHTYEKKTFVDYAVRMDLISNCCMLEISPLTTIDDITFNACFKMLIPRKNEADIYAVGINSFVVKDDLLHRVFVHYNQDDDEYNRIQSALSYSHQSANQPTQKTESEQVFFS